MGSQYAGQREPSLETAAFIEQPILELFSYLDFGRSLS